MFFACIYGDKKWLGSTYKILNNFTAEDKINFVIVKVYAWVIKTNSLI